MPPGTFAKQPKDLFFFKALTRSEFFAEEITQEVFYKVWLKRRDLRGIQYFNAYLKTIAKNVFSNYLKRMAHEKLILRNISRTSASIDKKGGMVKKKLPFLDDCALRIPK